MNTPIDHEKARIAALLAWCAERGASASGLEIKTVDGLRGVYATRDFEPGETLLHVPSTLFLSAREAQASSLVQRIGSSCPDLSQQVHLAAFLIDARRRGLWRPYIDALPPSQAHLPIFGGSGAGQWIEGSCAKRIARDRFNTIRREFRQLRAALPAQDRFTLREYAWARCTVGSRIFGMSIEGTMMSGMVPLADMLNCAVAPLTAWSCEDSQGFYIVAIRPVARDDQVTTNYGWPNTTSFAQSGFALENNPYDAVRLRFRFPPGHFIARLHRITVPEPVFELDVGNGYEHRGTASVFNFLRTACRPDYAAGLKLRFSQNTLLRLPAIDADSERAVLALLKDACELRLREFRDPIEHDEALLRDGVLDEMQRFAVITRHGEKRLLHELLSLARKVSAALGLQRPDRDAALARLAEGAGNYAGYVDELRRMEGRSMALCG